jgi:hypothetical protein
MGSVALLKDRRYRHGGENLFSRAEQCGHVRALTLLAYSYEFQRLGQHFIQHLAHWGYLQPVLQQSGEE